MEICEYGWNMTQWRLLKWLYANDVLQVESNNESVVTFSGDVYGRYVQSEY